MQKRFLPKDNYGGTTVDTISVLIYHFCMNGKQVIKLLKDDGWEILRVRGSHYRLGKGDQHTTVPIHGKRDLGFGLLKAIEKQTGVKLL